MANNDVQDFNGGSIRSSNVNIDANYGPWTSIDGTGDSGSYMAWLDSKGVSTPKEGTLIAVKPANSSDVTLYVRSNGTWKPVGSGGSGSGNVSYDNTDAGTNYDVPGIVKYNERQVLTDSQKTQARSNIGALGQGEVSQVVSNLTYTKSEIDDSISQIQAASGGDLSGYYNKVQVNDKLDLKADKNTVVFATDVSQDILGAKTFKGETKLEGEFTSVNVLKLPELEAGKFLQLNNNKEVVGVSGMLVSQAEKNTWDTKQNRLTAGAGIDINGGTISVDYQSETAAQNGTDLSLVTTGEKYTWNNKQDAITAVHTTGTQEIGGEKTFTSDVVIGKTDSAADNKNLTVNGDVASGRTFTQTLQVYNNTTLGTATTQSQTSDSSTVINGSLTLADIAGANGGVLRVDSNGAVYADPSSYITGSIMVDTYDDLPTSGIEPGEVRFIKDTGKISTALQVVADTKLYVSIPNVYDTEAHVSKRVLEEMCTEERPIEQYNSFTSHLDEILDEDVSVDSIYGDYPVIPYREHKLTEDIEDNLYVVPVNHATYGKIMAVISEVTKKIWIVPTSSVGAINTWYVDEVGAIGGLSTGSLIEITDNYDDLPDDLTNVREFMTFGGGVIWSK